MTTNNSVNNSLGNVTATSLVFSPSTSGIVGTVAADNAAAGKVGEVISSLIVAASAVSLTTVTAEDMTSISLTAGDWDIYGNITFIASVAATTLICWASTTSATIPDGSLYSDYVGTGLTQLGISAPFLRVNVNTTTTVYISGYASFASGTCTMEGGIYARRVR